MAVSAYGWGNRVSTDTADSDAATALILLSSLAAGLSIARGMHCVDMLVRLLPIADIKKAPPRGRGQSRTLINTQSAIYRQELPSGSLDCCTAITLSA